VLSVSNSTTTKCKEIDKCVSVLEIDPYRRVKNIKISEQFTFPLLANADHSVPPSRKLGKKQRPADRCGSLPLTTEGVEDICSEQNRCTNVYQERDRDNSFSSESPVARWTVPIL
jgi:hypothetical protein